MSCRIPKYTLHKASGQAVVYIQRKPVYLGAYGSGQSRAKYDEVTGKWLKEQSPRRRARRS
jgi:hypothetical protein